MKLDWKGRQASVEQTIYKRCVKRHRSTDGCEQELERPDEVFFGELDDRNVPLLMTRMKSPVAGLMAKTTRLVHEQLRRVGLIAKDDVERKEQHLHDSRDVLCPPPTEVRGDDGAADDGPQRRPTDDCEGITGYGGAACGWRPKIAEDATGVCDGRSPEEAGEKAA